MASSEPDDPHIVLDDVAMAFDDRPVFEGLSCAFPHGRISVMLGGSGSGKTTVLRLIAGLVRPTRGTIRVDGRATTDLSESELAQMRSSIGMLFQGGALLDSLNVYDNVAFPLRERGRMSEAEIAGVVRDRLAAVGLDGVGDLLPRQLSGGMLRRAALARAIISNPKVLLCDEPFSGLDPISVKRIEVLLSRLNRRLGITVLVVSHHIPSTVRLADRVLLLLPGRAVSGTPEELRGSSDPAVAGFFDEDLDETLEPETVGGLLAAGSPEPRS
jgi:phospholipid/cholesterol/gamma-HCH transport system ATP-binding protein